MSFPDYTIHGWQDMHIVGLCALTCERDNTMTHRLLVDMDFMGASIMKELLGLSYGPADSMPFESNWNRMVGNNPACYSMMIPADWWQEIAVFGLLKMGADFVYTNGDCVWNDGGDDWKRLDKAWTDAENMAKVTIDPSTPEYYSSVSNLVPEYIRKTLRWMGLAPGQTINQVHAMTQRP